MSEFRIDKITNRVGDAGTQITGITTFSGTSGMIMPGGPPEYRGGRGRGLFGGGYNPTLSNVINYVEIGTLGNATDFGDLSAARKFVSSSGDSTRGLFMAGETPSQVGLIDYVDIQSKGGSNVFGNLSKDRAFGVACNSPTRGVYFSGYLPNPYAGTREIDYVIIKTEGNGTAFGDLVPPRYGAGAGSSATRGICGGGALSPGPVANMKNIEYIEIETGGTALDFGELSSGRHYVSAISNPTKTVWGGGVTPTTVNTIDYITTATKGNSSDWGDLTVAARGLGSGSATTPTRGLFLSGKHDSGYYNVINYITFSTTGNAVDFGDSTALASYCGAISDTNGGLG